VKRQDGCLPDVWIGPLSYMHEIWVAWYADECVRGTNGIDGIAPLDKKNPTSCWWRACHAAQWLMFVDPEDDTRRDTLERRFE